MSVKSKINSIDEKYIKDMFHTPEYINLFYDVKDCINKSLSNKNSVTIRVKNYNEKEKFIKIGNFLKKHDIEYKISSFKETSSLKNDSIIYFEINFIEINS